MQAKEKEIRTRIAGIIIQDDKLLMQKGKGYEELWTPGGKIDGNESDEECLRRELMEELGVELTSSKFFKEYQGTSFYNKNIQLTQRVYIASFSGTLVPSAEIESYLWFSKEEFYGKKYPMIDMTEKELIPDLIQEGIW